VGGLGGVPQAYNATDMFTPNYTAIAPTQGLPLPLASACFAPAINKSLAGSVTNVDVTIDALSSTPACAATQAALQRPLYLRVLLSQAVAAAMAANTSYAPVPGSGLGLVANPTAGGPSNQLGGVLTWAFLPSAFNRFRYSLHVPGVRALNDLCAQAQLPGQLPDTCILQIVSGNSTVWAGAIAESVAPLPPFPPISSPPPPDYTSRDIGSDDGGLSYNDKIAIIVCSVVGGLLLILIALLAFWLLYRHGQRKWAPAKQMVQDSESGNMSPPGTTMSPSDYTGSPGAAQADQHHALAPGSPSHLYSGPLDAAGLPLAMAGAGGVVPPVEGATTWAATSTPPAVTPTAASAEAAAGAGGAAVELQPVGGVPPAAPAPTPVATPTAAAAGGGQGHVSDDEDLRTGRA
jgi:hypothetical protein